MLGKSPSWQDADGACSGYLVEDGDTCLLLDCGNGVFSKLRRFRDYVDGRRGRHLAPARRPLPRPRPVRLRADLRAAPAAGAGRPLAGHRQRRRARSCIVPAGRPRRCAASSAPGATRTSSSNAFDVERVRARTTSSRSARCACASTRCPHFMPTCAVEVALGATAAGASPTAPTTARPTSSSGFADDTDLLMIEATLPRPERDGPARAPHARARPASTPRACAPAASC